MSEIVRWSIAPGRETAADVVAVFGDLVVLRLAGPDGGNVVVPTQVGALAIRPGYAGAWNDRIAERLAIGERVRATWIATPADGLPQAAIEDRNGSIDGSAIADGWALPTADAVAVAGVRQVYRSALETAARQRHGAWHDIDALPALYQEAQALYRDQLRLAPSFTAAYPGLSFLLVLVVLVALLWSMRQRNAEVTERTRNRGMLGRGAAWLVDIHTRFIPRTRFPPPGPPHA